jgi:hypothetical protein
MKLNTKQLRKQKNTITISTKESLKDIEPYTRERGTICLLFDKIVILLCKGQKKLMNKLKR